MNDIIITILLATVSALAVFCSACIMIFLYVLIRNFIRENF